MFIRKPGIPIPISQHIGRLKQEIAESLSSSWAVSKQRRKQNSEKIPTEKQEVFVAETCSVLCGVEQGAALRSPWARARTGQCWEHHG